MRGLGPMQCLAQRLNGGDSYTWTDPGIEHTTTPWLRTVHGCSNEPTIRVMAALFLHQATEPKLIPSSSIWPSGFLVQHHGQISAHSVHSWCVTLHPPAKRKRKTEPKTKINAFFFLHVMHEYFVHLGNKSLQSACPLAAFLFPSPGNSQSGSRESQGDEPSLPSHFILDYSSRGTGVLGLVCYCSGPARWICHRAISVLHSEAKYCRVENPVWRKWDARLKRGLDNACHHPYMQLELGHKPVFHMKEGVCRHWPETRVKSGMKKASLIPWTYLRYIWSTGSLISTAHIPPHHSEPPAAPTHTYFVSLLFAFCSPFVFHVCGLVFFFCLFVFLKRRCNKSEAFYCCSAERRRWWWESTLDSWFWGGSGHALPC